MSTSRFGYSPSDRFGRRDPRHKVARGTCVILVPQAHSDRPTPYDAVEVNEAGLCFVTPSPSPLEPGERLVCVTVAIEGFEILGSVIGVSLSEREDERVVGCMFVPATVEGERAWLCAVTSIASRQTGVEPSPSRPPSLAVRCRGCYRSMPVGESASEPIVAVVCPHCLTSHSLPRPADMAESGTRDRVRRFAIHHAIDLPAAYSVVLGLLSLEQVRDTTGARDHVSSHVASQDDATTSPGDADPSEERVDPAFQRAIDAGTLSAAVALQRGSRQEYASRLAARHGLPMPLALDVADNKVSLVRAVREQAAARLQPAERPSSWSTALARGAVAILAAVGLWSLVERGQPPRPEPPQQRPADSRSADPPAGRVRTPTHAAPTVDSVQAVEDDHGRLTRLSASSPQVVLREYCRRESRVPVGLSAGAVPDSSTWLGVFRDPTDPTVDRAIAIRRDRETGRWFAGDGRSSIAPFRPDRLHIAEIRELPPAPG